MMKQMTLRDLLGEPNQAMPVLRFCCVSRYQEWLLQGYMQQPGMLNEIQRLAQQGQSNQGMEHKEKGEKE